MEKDEHEPHPDYLKGFNEGYMMAKYMPELTDKLSKSLGRSERGIGFSDGRSEFLAEKGKENYPNWLKSSFRERNEMPGKDRPKNMGMDHDRDI